MLGHLPTELKTERCILKRLELENAADLYQIYGDALTMNYMQMPCLESVEQCEEMLGKWDELFSRGVSCRWGLYLSDFPSRLIGTAALHYWSPVNRRVELGADLHRDYWGRGIITEITSRLIDLAFDSLEVNRIELRCHPGNTGSVVIAGKLGFVFEGTLRSYVHVPGKGLVDEAVYSLLASERFALSSAEST